MQVKVTARTKRGAPITTVSVSDEETMNDILNIISDELAKNESSRVWLDKWIEGGRMMSIDRTRECEVKFRIPSDEPWKIYENTGDAKRDRLVMYATPSGAMLEGPGLGTETAQLYELVPEALVEMALGYWKEK